MPVGFQVFNDGGYLQIDADFKNMELKQKGTFSISPTNAMSGGTTTSVFNVSYAGQAPVIAVFCGSYCYVGTSVNGSTFAFSIVNAENAVISGEYFIFDVSDETQTTRSGMQIFNAAGQQVFDAGKKYMKVIDYFDAPLNEAARSYPGKKVAWVMTDFGYSWNVQMPPTGPSDTVRMVMQNTYCAKSVTGSVSTMLRAMYVNGNVPYRPEMQSKSEGPSRWLVIDVTNA